MSTAKKLFHVLSAAYILIGFGVFAANNFSVRNGVDRSPPRPECNVQIMANGSLDDIPSGCTEDAMLHMGHHFTWVGWQFFSNNRGNDVAIYNFADTVVLVIANTAVFFVSRKKNHNSRYNLA